MSCLRKEKAKKYPANILHTLYSIYQWLEHGWLVTVDDSNSFFSPYKILPIAQENKYLGMFFLLDHGIVCCAYSLESPHRGDSNEYTQHTIIV